MKILIILFCMVIFFASCSCTKSNFRGSYSGTAYCIPRNTHGTLTYHFKENNFTIGSETPDGPTTTNGGYRITKDSIIISSWYNANNDYYLVSGKFYKNKKTISGNYKNLTDTTDYGTFTMSAP